MEPARHLLAKIQPRRPTRFVTGNPVPIRDRPETYVSQHQLGRERKPFDLVGMPAGVGGGTAQRPGELQATLLCANEAQSVAMRDLQTLRGRLCAVKCTRSEVLDHPRDSSGACTEAANAAAAGVHRRPKGRGSPATASPPPNKGLFWDEGRGYYCRALKYAIK